MFIKGHPYYSKGKKCSIENCGKRHYGDGYCNKHYTRNIRNGSPYKVSYIKLFGTPEERYHQCYKKRLPNECWNWIKCHSKNGYGIFSFNNKAELAHRFGWELRNKKTLTRFIYVCHTCDNRSCQNPKHWFIGTPLDNVRDMISKKRNYPPPH